MSSKKLVLVTGCSDGGLGSALALALHAHGSYRVIATARNPNKLSETRKAGIEDLQLDVLSDESIAACVEKVKGMNSGRLDMLINNAGAGFNMPVLDANTKEARKVFDLNVWSMIAVARAFIPLLLESSDARIVNNISVAAYSSIPMQGIYNSSKAAANMLTETLRLELKPFGVKVIALLTGDVQSQFFANMGGDTGNTLPEDSIYKVVPNGLTMLRDAASTDVSQKTPSAVWAKMVVQDISRANPPYQVWRGANAGLVRFSTLLPLGTLDKQLMERASMGEIEEALKQKK